MRQPAVLFIHRYPGPLLGPGSVRSILGESLVKDQLLNMNRFRQRCMKARPDTPTCTIQIAFVLLIRSGAPGGIRTPDLLVRSQTLYPAELRAHGTPFAINSLPQFLLRFQPRASLLTVIWERCFV